jgi:ketosteroid isomerase-like protein
MVARRSAFLFAFTALLAPAFGACSDGGNRPVPTPRSALDTAAIGDTLRLLVESAYDLSRPDVVERIMNLYPERGPVVSASGGRVITSRDTLRAQVQRFWDWTGQNMQQPRWEWIDSHVWVLGPDAAVMTATYRVPHRTPEGRSHVIGGAWTMAFERRDDRWVIVHEHLSDLPAQ